MISYEEIKQSIKQPAPSAQLKPQVKPTQPKKAVQGLLQPVGSFIGKALQKFPDTTVKANPKVNGEKYSTINVGPAKVPVTDIGAKAIPFATSLVGNTVKSIGKSIETVSTPEGRKSIAQGVTKIPSQIAKRDVSGIIQNPAVSTALDASNFFPGVGLVGAGIKETSRAAAKEAVKEAVAKQAVRKTIDPIADRIAAETKGVNTGMPQEAKPFSSGVKPPEMPPSAEIPPNGDGALVQKTIQALKDVKPLRGDLEKTYTTERSKRIVAGEQAYEAAGGGQAGVTAKQAALGGKLADQPKFNGLKLLPEEVNRLQDLVHSNQVISPYEKVSAHEGVKKLVEGRVPNNYEIGLLHDVFGKDFADAATIKLGKWDKIQNAAANVAGLTRELKSSFDLSAPLRQGIFAAPSHPKEFATAFVKMFQYAVSPKAYNNLYKEIQSSPHYMKMRESDLALTRTDGAINQREEAFISNLGERIPVLGKFVAGSNRAYTGFLNKFRADMFNNAVDKAKFFGKADDPKYLRDMASLINDMTGRGNLPGTLQSAAPALNVAFFSPRLIASRLNLMVPIRYIKADSHVRKEYVKSLAAFVLTGMSILGLAALAGGKVGTDWRSADFGKIRIGNIRYDIWGGFQQYAVLIGREYSGQSVSSASGKTYEIGGSNYASSDRLDILGRFLRQKAAPVPSFAMDTIAGRDVNKYPVDFTTLDPTQNEVAKQFFPLFLSDLKSVIEENPELGTILAVPGLFGVGIGAYKDSSGGKGTRTRSSTRVKSGVGTRIR